MPMRDFKCSRCGFILEDIHFRTDREEDLTLPKSCPKCKARKFEWIRMFPRTSFVMK